MMFHSYQEFWPFYLSQHSKKATRVWHAIGTSRAFIIDNFDYFALMVADCVCSRGGLRLGLVQPLSN
jgi:hypothetical protein